MIYLGGVGSCTLLPPQLQAGRTPLDLAKMEGHAEAARFLEAGRISRGAIT